MEPLRGSSAEQTTADMEITDQPSSSFEPSSIEASSSTMSSEAAHPGSETSFDAVMDPAPSASDQTLPSSEATQLPEKPEALPSGEGSVENLALALNKAADTSSSIAALPTQATDTSLPVDVMAAQSSEAAVVGPTSDTALPDSIQSASSATIHAPATNLLDASSSATDLIGQQPPSTTTQESTAPSVPDTSTVSASEALQNQEGAAATTSAADLPASSSLDNIGAVPEAPTSMTELSLTQPEAPVTAATSVDASVADSATAASVPQSSKPLAEESAKPVESEAIASATGTASTTADVSAATQAPGLSEKAPKPAPPSTTTDAPPAEITTSAVEPASLPSQEVAAPAESTSTSNAELESKSATAAESTTKSNESAQALAPEKAEQSESKPDGTVAAPKSQSETAAAPVAETVVAPQAAASSIPATPEKKAASETASGSQPATSQPSTPAREGRVALILRINKELIRLCVDLQAKGFSTDPVYREVALRLQMNLGYLAGIADKSGKGNDPNRPSAAPNAALPKLEPFPRSDHAPSSPIPALYDKLMALFGPVKPADSPTAEGRKRSRDSTVDLGGDEAARQRAASRGVDRSQDVSAAGTPSSTANQQGGASQPAEAAAGTQAGTKPNAASTPASQQLQQQQQQAQQPPQQPGKGPDLSLAPPVPIAPPAGAQNIPNNPQAQALMQAFGPNALVNLHALQSHMRGQGTHPWVAFMEANVNGFKAMPLQVQLQHMTSLQNAGLQRQKGMQTSGGVAAGVGSPANMQQPNGGIGIGGSPATTRPMSTSDSPGQAAQASPSARVGTPSFPNRPGSSGSVGSMTSGGGRNRTGSSHLAFDPSQMQSAPSPATMASMTDFAAQQQQQGGMGNFGFQPPGLQQGSPAAAASPQTQQPQQQPPQGMMMGNMNIPNLQNLPPHLQQQIKQQYLAHLQAQQQQQQGWNFQTPQS